MRQAENTHLAYAIVSAPHRRHRARGLGCAALALFLGRERSAGRADGLELFAPKSGGDHNSPCFSRLSAVETAGHERQRGTPHY